jgi:probable F420-dependent oxidoreductase
LAFNCGPEGAPDYQSWRAAVIHAEELGADVVFGYDHFHAPAMEGIVDGKPLLSEVQPDVNNFEGWTALASWAEITTRAEIGLLVTGVGFRNPDLLADMTRTVDHISGGRVILGLGAGWYEKDYTTYGYDFGTLKSRMGLFDEGLQRVADRLERLIPPPVRKIPILIGGSGAKRTIPAVARHADMWHSFLPADDFRRASAVVGELAEANGRKDGDIERSSVWENAGDADAYRDAGVTLFVSQMHPTAAGYDFSTLEKMIEWRDGA